MLLMVFVALATVGTMVWAAYSPAVAGWTYLSVVFLFELWLSVLQLSYRSRAVRSSTVPLSLTEEEAAIVNRYPLFFRFPMASRLFASALSAVNLASVVWIPLLLYKSQWFPAFLFAANYLVVSNLVPRLDPQHFFRYNIRAGKAPHSFAADLASLESALHKVVFQSGGAQP